MEENALRKDKFNLLVIGGSAGCLDVIMNLLSRLDLSIQIPVVIVIHRLAEANSRLAELLQAKTSRKVKEAEEKEMIRKGIVYLAPPDYHLLIENDHSFSLDYSEKIHFCRPAIDATFETAADAYGASVAVLLLSGANADGSTGIEKIKSVGGLTIVQRPSTAEIAFMPEHAMKQVEIDLVLDPEEIVAFVNSF